MVGFLLKKLLEALDQNALHEFVSSLSPEEKSFLTAKLQAYIVASSRGEDFSLINFIIIYNHISDNNKIALLKLLDQGFICLQINSHEKLMLILDNLIGKGKDLVSTQNIIQEFIEIVGATFIESIVTTTAWLNLKDEMLRTCKGDWLKIFDRVFEVICWQQKTGQIVDRDIEFLEQQKHIQSLQSYVQDLQAQVQSLQANISSLKIEKEIQGLQQAIALLQAEEFKIKQQEEFRLRQEAEQLRLIAEKEQLRLQREAELRLRQQHFSYLPVVPQYPATTLSASTMPFAMLPQSCFSPMLSLSPQSYLPPSLNPKVQLIEAFNRTIREQQFNMLRMAAQSQPHLVANNRGNIKRLTIKLFNKDVLNEKIIHALLQKINEPVSLNILINELKKYFYQQKFCSLEELENIFKATDVIKRIKMLIEKHTALFFVVKSGIPNDSGEDQYVISLPEAPKDTKFTSASSSSPTSGAGSRAVASSSSGSASSSGSRAVASSSSPTFGAGSRAIASSSSGSASSSDLEKEESIVPKLTKNKRNYKARCRKMKEVTNQEDKLQQLPAASSLLNPAEQQALPKSMIFAQQVARSKEKQSQNQVLSENNWRIRRLKIKLFNRDVFNELLIHKIIVQDLNIDSVNLKELIYKLKSYLYKTDFCSLKEADELVKEKDVLNRIKIILKQHDRIFYIIENNDPEKYKIFLIMKDIYEPIFTQQTESTSTIGSLIEQQPTTTTTTNTSSQQQPLLTFRSSTADDSREMMLGQPYKQESTEQGVSVLQRLGFSI